VQRPLITELPESVFVSDRNGPTPIYHDLAARLEAAIVAGELPPGSRLENEESLSERLGVSRPTLRRVTQELVDKGLLVRRRGIGTVVVPPSLARKMELTSLWDDLSKMGKNPSTRLLLHELIPAGVSVADDLGINSGDTVLHLRRLRFANKIPMVVLENFLPERYADITSKELTERGLYQSLDRRGVTVQVAHQSVTARRATAEEAELLRVHEGDPLLNMKRTAFDASGQPTETGFHSYHPELYSFEVTLVRN